MRDIEHSLQESQSFLPLQSTITPQTSNDIPKSQKKRKPLKGKSVLYEELKKVRTQSTEIKRQCVFKYLCNKGQLKDTVKAISTIEQEGYAIPILQVAVALSRYDNQFLKELLDAKSIELKENKESEIYQMNKILQTDPILDLISDFDNKAKMPQQQKQPSFIDFKNISPRKKNELIDLEKGKLKKSKSKHNPMIEYPKELSDLKKDLMSLPYINRYKNIIGLKSEINDKKQNQLKQGSSLENSPNEKLSHLSDLNLSKKSFKTNPLNFQLNSELEKTLNKSLQKRVKNFQVSTKQLGLPKLQKIDRNYFSKSLMEIKQCNLTTKYPIENFQSYNNDIIRDTEKSSDINPEDYDKSMKSSLNRKRTLMKNKKQKYWPEYKGFSPYNNKSYVSEIEKLKSKVRSITELSQIPSQETLGVYESLKRLQKNDLNKLQNQSLNEERLFSHTKYKVKYNNLKESYSKRLKEFIKDKKVRQFELQQSLHQEQSNLTINKVKLNNKILQKMVLHKKDQK